MLELLAVLLVGGLVIGVPAAVIVLLVTVSGLKRRLEAVERRVALLQVGAGQGRVAPGPAREAGPWGARAAAPETAPDTAPEPAPGTGAGAEAAPPSVPEAPAPVPPEETAAEELAAARVPPAPSAFDRGLLWLRENWFYAVSAVSLGLAGIFLVQYGVETGLLTPLARVLLALALGAALVVAGEAVRRRWGDEGSHAAVLPSTFSGAGIVVLYGAILAARGLYGLIGPETAVAGLVVVSAMAVVFGWFYGPFLAAAGLTGAAAAPFLVGGDADSGTIFYIYYALLGATAMAVDAMRRWGWVSALGLGLAYAAGSLVYTEGGGAAGYMVLLTALAVLAIALPRLQATPTHPRPTLLESLQLLGGEAGTAVPPVRIAAAAMAVSAGLLWLAGTGGAAAEAMLALVLLVALMLAVAVWAARAPGLSDLAVLPAAGFLGLLLSSALDRRPLFLDYVTFVAPNQEVSPPATAAVILLLATAGTLGLAWRSFRGPWPPAWAAGAVIFAPAAAVVLELFWHPARVIGAGQWAVHALALAALMTLFAERFARADGEDRRRAAYATLSALSLIALALFVVLAEAALTVALSVLVATAAALDRRFRLPEMRWFLLAGVAVLGWRLIVDPGLPDYLREAPLAEVLLAFGAALAGLGAALAVLPGGRADARAVLESALWAYGGVFLSILLWRGIAAAAPAGEPLTSHWSVSLLGLVWTLLALAQARRLGGTTALRPLRIALALGYAAAAALAFLLALTVLNPVFGVDHFLGVSDRVLGPQPLDTLSVAYLVPALLFAAVALRVGWLPRRGLGWWAAGLFGAAWLFLQIRRFWHGQALDAAFTQPELYSFTVAMLAVGGVLLYQAIAAQNPTLRRLAVLLIAATVAKVFLIDTSGLTGLLRVFSFLALGLVLAGLAWLNRWAAARQSGPAAGAAP